MVVTGRFWSIVDDAEPWTLDGAGRFPGDQWSVRMPFPDAALTITMTVTEERMLTIHWTLTVHIPQLKALGAQLMAGLQEIREAIVAQGDRLVAHGEAIVAGMDHLAQHDTIDPAAVTALADLVRGHTAAIDAHTARMRAMIPDEPPPEPAG